VKKAAFLWVGLFFAAGCAAVGPDYKRTDPPVPPSFGSLEKGISKGESADPKLLSSWWKIFNDPVLNDLIEKAVERNLDVRIARARVQQARALRGISESGLFPEGGVSAGYQAYRRTETGSTGQAPGAGAAIPGKRQGEAYQVGFDASWEIDIFGGVRREVEAADADLAASEDGMRGALISLQGEVARNYIELRGLQLRVNIAFQEVKSRRENLGLVEARFRAGLVNQLDVTRVKGELSSAEARIPPLENAVLAVLHRLGVLLGQEPMSLVEPLRVARELPEVPPDLPAGLPSELLRRRPDIRRAERELAAATARIGVSTAELFPKFSLTGVYGFQSDRLDRLVRDGSNFWRIGPGIQWPILNLKRILNHIDATKAVREETLARYEKTILLSLEEVENALVLLFQEKERASALGRAVESNSLAVELAVQRYKSGLQSYLSVLDAESALFTAQDQLAQSRQNRAVGLVALYKALGGGWENYYGE
jgi:NodT family efflux transporter outer membrane factor (OMF) lipoprotein